jgi:hypothetical protein
MLGGQSGLIPDHPYHARPRTTSHDVTGVESGACAVRGEATRLRRSRDGRSSAKRLLPGVGSKSPERDAMTQMDACRAYEYLIRTRPLASIVCDRLPQDQSG